MVILNWGSFFGLNFEGDYDYTLPDIDSGSPMMSESIPVPSFINGSPPNGSIKDPSITNDPSPSNNHLHPPAQPTLTRKLSVPRKNVFAVASELLKTLKYLFMRTPNARYYDRFIKAFTNLFNDCQELEPAVFKVQKIADRFDLDEKTPGNGYRSLICLVDTALLHLIGLLRIVDQRCSDLTFRTSFYCKEIEAYAGIMAFLAQAFKSITQLMESNSTSSLFTIDADSDLMLKLMSDIESLDITCFYGRAIGFHYCTSVTRVFNVIGVALATYSCNWLTGGPISSAISAGRFWLSPETCAKQIVTTTQRADIAFCKAFWNLTEMGVMQKMPDWFCPVLFINDLMDIPAEYDQFLPGVEDDLVKIPPPSAHTGRRPIKARYLAARAFQGIDMKHRAKDMRPACPYLIFNCHGGGFVATTSKSHETYLRQWAKILECPILSIDYSLAPENPFPRAIEEALYAYAWAQNHREKLGWTGDKVCFVGDSAGGNLLVAVTLRLIQLGVKKLPTALVPIYTPFLFQYTPSPSRVLSLIDPLLPNGIVLRCVAAYTGHFELIDKGKMTTSPTADRKSLQEYFDEAQRQRAQYEKVDVGESQDIVNLVNINNTNDNNDKWDLGAALSDDEYESNEFIDRRRSQSVLVTGSHKDKNTVEVLDEQVPQVAVHRKDGDRIWMTTSIHSEDLVDYLSIHPMTKDDVLIVHTPTVVANTAVTQSDKSPLTPSHSVNSIPDLQFNATNANGHKPLVRTEHISPIRKKAASESQPPMSRKVSWTNSMSDVMALATGHASDMAAGLIERTTTVPNSESETMTKLKQLAVPKDPLISPIFASDELLAKMPPVYLVGCHMDPLLDDSVEFAKRLRKVGAKVELDLLDSLPHGFLNFTLMSAECREGAKVCVQRMKTALGMPGTPTKSLKNELNKFQN